MKNGKIVLLTVFSIAVNILGKLIAENFVLPLWLDSFGTVVSAYILGPVAGGAVGLTTNLIYGMVCSSTLTMFCGIINLVIGVIVGICARKRMLRDVFGTMCVSCIVTFASVIFSTPINIFINGGKIKGTFTADELRKACSEYYHIDTDNNEKAAAILVDKCHINHMETMEDGSLRIYDGLDDLLSVSKSLYEGGVIPTSLTLNEVNLEEYYLKLVEESE